MYHKCICLDGWKFVKGIDIAKDNGDMSVIATRTGRTVKFAPYGAGVKPNAVKGFWRKIWKLKLQVGI